MKKTYKFIPAVVCAVVMLATSCTEDDQPMVPEDPDTEVPTPPTPPPPGDNSEKLLTGTVIGTRYSVDYDSGQASESVNTKKNVFDNDFSTFFASHDRSGTWVGLDLKEKHIITKIGYAPRRNQPGRVELAVLEGANKADFSDAIPIHMIKEPGIENKMTYADVKCSRGFRYVRYMTPNNVRCNLAELQFYGKKGEGDDSQLYQITNLPTVVINTYNAQDIVSKEYEITSTVYIISDGGKTLLCDEETGVKGRGNASWGFPKKPYRLKFSSKRSPLGAPAKEKKWTLINNYGDKTLMRNILAFETSRRLGLSYTPFCHPVDVILNGEYKGCYQLCDQVEAAANRVEAKDGYLIEIDAYANGEACYFYSSNKTPVTIKHPDEDDITKEQKEFITNYFNQMENAVFSSDHADPEKGYRQYLDLDSFLRLFLVGEFAGNTDTYWSVYMYKDAGNGKLYCGPAWDYDLAFENDNRTYPVNELSDFIYATKGSVASESVRRMVNRIVKEDEEAGIFLQSIWNDARKKGLDATTMVKYVDETAALLDESQKLNFKRWPILDKKVHQNHTARGTYTAEVNAVKLYIAERLSKMDELVKQ